MAFYLFVIPYRIGKDTLATRAWNKKLWFLISLELSTLFKISYYEVDEQSDLKFKSFGPQTIEYEV